MSTARDIDTRGADQGAGLVDAYRAVQAARSLRATATKIGDGLLYSPNAINVVSDTRSQQHDAGDGDQRRREHARRSARRCGRSARRRRSRAARCSSTRRPTRRSPTRTGRPSATSTRSTFTVPASTDRLHAAIAWQQSNATNPASRRSGSTCSIQRAGWSASRARRDRSASPGGGFSEVEIHNAQPGTWKMVTFDTAFAGPDSYTGPLAYQLTSQSFTTGQARSVRRRRPWPRDSRPRSGSRPRRRPRRATSRSRWCSGPRRAASLRPGHGSDHPAKPRPGRPDVHRHRHRRQLPDELLRPGAPVRLHRAGPPPGHRRPHPRSPIPATRSWRSWSTRPARRSTSRAPRSGTAAAPTARTSPCSGRTRSRGRGQLLVVQINDVESVLTSSAVHRPARLRPGSGEGRSTSRTARTADLSRVDDRGHDQRHEHRQPGRGLHGRRPPERPDGAAADQHRSATRPASRCRSTTGARIPQFLVPPFSTAATIGASSTVPITLDTSPNFGTPDVEAQSVRQQRGG